jgi:hypothetical protein
MPGWNPEGKVPGHPATCGFISMLVYPFEDRQFIPRIVMFGDGRSLEKGTQEGQISQ